VVSNHQPCRAMEWLGRDGLYRAVRPSHTIMARLKVVRAIPSEPSEPLFPPTIIHHFQGRCHHNDHCLRTTGSQPGDKFILQTADAPTTSKNEKSPDTMSGLNPLTFSSKKSQLTR
jgi:hypothetical protein